MIKKKKNEGTNRYYSLAKKLKREGKTNEEFEIIFNNLSLEEVIGLKLELASRFAFNGKMYGLPIWISLPNIVRDAVLKFAVSATRTKNEAARFLGLNVRHLHALIKKYEIDDYFQEEVDKEP